jgi:two-component system, LytTR family, response regulator
MDNSQQTIKTIIVDDEKPSRDSLVNYINEYCPVLQVVSTCKTAKEAYKAILEHNPQLVFLDIQMPKATGFDLLRMFKTIDFIVVFITAYSEYATRAFRVAAADFLLKPVKVTELTDAVRKVQEALKYKSLHNFETLLEYLKDPEGPIRKIIIPNQKGFVVLNLTDIILCKADGYCTHFHLAGNSKITGSHHLKYYEDLLPDKQFLRVHNSYIINLQHVLAYTNQGDILLNDNLSAPLSLKNKDAFFHYYRNMKH